MEISEIQVLADKANMGKIQHAMALSSWPMKVEQIAQAARLSLKTVKELLDVYANFFIEDNGVYSLRVKNTPAPKPATQIAAPVGFDAGLLREAAAKSDAALDAAYSIEQRDAQILKRMFEVISEHKSGIITRDLCNALNMPRNKIYDYAGILISQKKIHNGGRSNRMIKYKAGPAPEPQKHRFFEKIEVKIAHERFLTLSFDEVKELLLNHFEMDELNLVRDNNNLRFEMSSKKEFRE